MMMDRENQDGAGLADDAEALETQAATGSDSQDSGTEDSDDEELDSDTRASGAFAPDPGDPGGMGGVRAQGGNPLHRPPGGTSPIPHDENSDGD